MKTMNDLTNVQKRVYYIIKDYIEKHGYSPTIREIAKFNGTTSPSTVFYHLKNLKQKGYIDFNEKMKRTIQIKK